MRNCLLPFIVIALFTCGACGQQHNAGSADTGPTDTGPADGGTTPQDGGSTPQDGGTTPQDGGTTPKDGGTADVFDCTTLDCGAHGTCNATSGNCACETDWSGAACDVFDCNTLNCGAHGTCSATSGTCVCENNWSGTLCDTETPLEIIGNYVDNWGSDHEITQTTWTTMGSVFHITQFSNTDDFLVAQNDAANAYNPSLWSRFDWTRDAGNDLFYCQIAYDAATEAAAVAATGAKRDDLTAGCSGFAWSKLTPK